jgi:hypothetical protein
VDANGVKTPIGEEDNDAEPQELQLLPSIGANGEPTIRNFQSLVGSLLWIARCTRPDISFAVHKATRHTHQPRTTDWKLAKRIARYLKATKTLKLRMDIGVADGRCIQVESWSFAADKGDRKSVTGGVVTMDGAIVHWICKKQTGVLLSTMEAKFTSAPDVGRELLGLRELVRELHFAVSQPMPMPMDNQAAIKQLESEASMASAKHVDIRIKFICDYARRGIVEPKYVASRLMKADLLTKAFPAPRMAELRQIVKLT